MGKNPFKIIGLLLEPSNEGRQRISVEGLAINLDQAHTWAATGWNRQIQRRKAEGRKEARKVNWSASSDWSHWFNQLVWVVQVDSPNPTHWSCKFIWNWLWTLYWFGFFVLLRFVLKIGLVIHIYSFHIFVVWRSSISFQLEWRHIATWECSY